MKVDTRNTTETTSETAKKFQKNNIIKVYIFFMKL